MPVAGKAQMANAAQPLLLQKIGNDAPALVQIGGQGALVNVMQQIKIKVIHAALFQLLLKDRRRVVALLHLMSGILRGQIEAFPRGVRQRPANDPLGRTAVVGVCRVKVIHAAVEGQLYHSTGGLLIHLAGGQGGQAHGAKAQQGQLFTLKGTI